MSFHILSMYPDHTNPTEMPHSYPGYISTRSQASTETNSFHYYVKKILWGGCGSTSENDFTQSKSVSSTHGSPKVAVSTSCVECLRVAGSVPTFPGILVAALIHELKMQFPNATIIHNGGVVWVEGILYVDDLRLISGKNSR